LFLISLGIPTVIMLFLMVDGSKLSKKIRLKHKNSIKNRGY